MVIDAHMHVPRLSTVSDAWFQWAVDYGKDQSWREVFDRDGDPVPEKLEALLDREGVDRALLFAEYSPHATGVQTADDVLPLIEHNPHRFSLVANVNPARHDDPAAAAARQLDLGAVAVKIHPVHGGFTPDAPALAGVYELCVSRDKPLITHTGPSIFPGSVSANGDPRLFENIADRYPGLTLVLAHGGRGRWYADAARMALDRDNVWLDLAGLPPQRLLSYYEGFDLEKLASRWIFGTDWPGVPGIAANVARIQSLGLSEDTLTKVLNGNARKIYLELTRNSRRPMGVVVGDAERT
jgi:uncharacterized protein